MSVEGQITTDGKSYAWTSPTLADLEEFEEIIGPITDVAIVNSARGRAYLAHLCLREKQPELTLGIVRGWRAGVWSDLWSAIKQAIPLFDEEEKIGRERGDVRPPAAAPAGDAQPGSATSSPSPSSDTPDGSLPERAENA